MKLTLGISPCPNDTFIFDALIHKKIDTLGLDFEVYLEDVETLNKWALEGKLDCSKVSYGVWPLLTANYNLLDAGGALGNGVGPLLISKAPVEDLNTAIENFTIAVPGEHTTAHLLLSFAFPNIKHKCFMNFAEIEEAVLTGKVDCGVVIHEGRFTYEQKGLHKLLDLGEYWQNKLQCPIPLGGIVMKNTIDRSIQQKVNGLIRTSLSYSLTNYPHITEYVKQHAQEMSEDVMRKHIDLYVNFYSVTLDTAGRNAIKQLVTVYNRLYNADVSIAATTIIS